MQFGQVFMTKEEVQNGKEKKEQDVGDAVMTGRATTEEIDVNMERTAKWPREQLEPIIRTFCQ